MFPTADQHDAIAAVELARAEAEWLAGRPLRDLNARDVDGSVLPLIVTDNGGPFRSFRFERSSPHTLNCGMSAPASAHRGRTASASAGPGH